MSQHAMTIANQPGASLRADLNNMAAALVSQSSGTAAPATTYAFQLWADTTTGMLKIRNSANSAWITIGPLSDLGIQSGKQNTAAAGGTADALTGTFTPDITPSTLVHGLRVTLTGCSANGTTTPTFFAGSTSAIGIVKGANSAVAAGDILGNADLEYNYGYGKWVLMNPATGVAISATSGGTGANDFRLSLTSGTPVTSTDVTGATTIYCTPYKGKGISLYDGSKWNTRVSNEFSLALGTLTSGKPYDVFCYDSAGVPTLEFLAWTNDTTRATALAYQDGILVKSGAATRRYLGSFYTTATTTTEDSAANRYLWNYYNRAASFLDRKEGTASWTYTTATWRQANASTSNQLNFIVGVAEDAIEAKLQFSGANSGGFTNQIGGALGFDTTTTPVGEYSSPSASAGLGFTNITAQYAAVPAAGRHYISWLEWSAAVNTTTFYGIYNTSTQQAQSGLSARFQR